jgi:hypothetical protein
MTSKWFKTVNSLINLDKCAHIIIHKNNNNIWKITFYDHNTTDPKIDGESRYDNVIEYLSEDSALKDFNKIVEIVTNKDDMTKLKDMISKLNDEISELRKMIIHLPVVGSVYVEAKEEFESNSKIEN